MTDLFILAALLSGPKHGYQLKHEAGIVLGQGVLHNNLVYPLLRRFMNNKWVARKVVPGERGQTRQQYSVTALGRKELLARLSAFSEHDARSFEAFRFRVATFGLLEPQVRARILDARESFLRTQVEKIAAIRAHFHSDHYSGEVIALSLTEAKAELDWIARLRRFEKSRKDDSHE